MILKRLSISYQVLIAAVIGIIVGILFGDKASIFEPIGRIYAMLMEAVVFPYLISTLLHSLGGLTPSLSMKLLRKGWIFYILLTLLIFIALIVLGQALPLNIAPVSNSMQSSPSNALLKFLVPDNIFSDLASNYVPAVIVFCILFGLALQRIANKANLFVILEIISKTCLLFWNWLVMLVPIATFALLANLAGTIHLQQLFDVSEFLILYMIGTLLSFWILPLVLTAFTGIRYRALFYEMRDALIVSAITTLSVVALPYLERMIAKFLAEHRNKNDDQSKDEIIKTVLLVSYPLIQIGNFFVYLFILFAALYYDHTISTLQSTFLPLITFFSAIGSPSSSINSVQFLSSWLNLPDDTVNLYISLMPIFRYPQVLLSVLGIAFLGVIVSFSFFDLLKKINYRKIALHLAIGFVMLLFLATMLCQVFPNPDEKLYHRLIAFTLEPQLTTGVKVTIRLPVDETKLQPVKKAEDSLFRIQRTGVLRVGFNADMRPFVFYNNKQQLVGYDIAYAYALAKALNSRIEFIPFTWPNLVHDLERDQFDIAMAAIYATEQRLTYTAFTEPYFHSPASVVVSKDKQAQFQTVEQIKNIPNLRIGVFNDPVLIPLVQNNFPNAKIVILASLSGNDPAVAFAHNEIDAVLWSQVQTDVWVLDHPQYASLVPQGIAAPFLMAYMVQNTSPQFLNFLNYWLTLKKNDGFQERMNKKWILMRNTDETQPRFSLL